MQKIAICGKGGSGKSTVTCLLANGIRKRGHPVLVVDSDESNTGLSRMLGFDAPPVSLLDFMGGKAKLEEDLLEKIKSGIPETVVELFQREISIEDIPEAFIRHRDGLRLVVIGKILKAQEGCSCPMGIISRSFLKKIRLGKGEIALVDMEAGVEHFGRGVETGIDTVLIVVDPSLDSLEIAGRIHALSIELAIGDVGAVLNKISTPKIRTRITEELENRGVPVWGAIRQDGDIFENSVDGIPVSGRLAEEDVDHIFEKIFP